MFTARNKWRNNEEEISFNDINSNITKENDFNKTEIWTINDNDNNLEDDSYNMQFMFTARNKWRNNNKEIASNNMHEILEIKEDLKIYKYSNVEKKSVHKMIYQYHYDKYDKKDFKNAKIILFIGKTGDGKTTAINAFFNIIKGIKREDKYRYILIKEPKKKKRSSRITNRWTSYILY